MGIPDKRRIPNRSISSSNASSGDVLIFDGTDWVPGQINPGVISKNYKYKMKMNYTSSTSVTVEAGERIADDGSTLLVVGSDTVVSLTAALANTNYHLYYDGTNYEWDTNQDGSGLIVITGTKRRVGSVQTDGSSNIKPFISDYFDDMVDYTWVTPQTEWDYNSFGGTPWIVNGCPLDSSMVRLNYSGFRSDTAIGLNAQRVGTNAPAVTNLPGELYGQGLATSVTSDIRVIGNIVQQALILLFSMEISSGINFGFRDERLD